MSIFKIFRSKQPTKVGQTPVVVVSRDANIQTADLEKAFGPKVAVIYTDKNFKYGVKYIGSREDVEE